MMLQRNSQRSGRDSLEKFTSRGASTHQLLAISAAVVAGSLYAKWARADVFGDLTAGGANLNQTASWIDETNPANVAIPGSGDIARWDNNSSGGTFTLGTSTSWLGLQIANPGSAVIIGNSGDSGNGLTLGTSGVDMSAATQGLTLFDPVTFGGAQTWTINTGQTLTQSGTVNNNGNNLIIAGAGNLSSGAIISGSGSLTMSGTGTLTLSKANTYSGGTIINSGTVSVAAPADAGNNANDTVTLNGGTLAIAGAGSAAFPNNIVAIAGDTATISIPATEELSGTASGSGTINVAVTGSGNAFDITNRSMFQTFTGTLALGSSTGYIREGSGSATYYIGGTLDLGSATGYFNSKAGGTITLGALQATGTGTVLYGATTSGDTTTFSVGSLGISTVFAGTIATGTGSSSSTTSLTVTGGTLALTGTANSYTGATTVSGGTLQLGNGGTTTSGSFGTAGVTDNSIVAFAPGSATSLTVPNVISGSGVVNHIGPGTTLLTGTNTYSGGTNVTGGNLVAKNGTSALGTGPVSVTGGILSGTGVVTAPVTVGPGGGQITGGTGGAGTLTLSSLTLNSGSSVVTNFLAAGPTNLINISTANGLSVNGGGIYLYGAGNAAISTNGGPYDIFQFPSPPSAVPSNLLTVLNPPSLGSPTYTWGVSGDDITVTISGLASAVVWQSSTGGSWTNAANWSGSIPNAVGSTATFATSPGITSPATVTLDGNETVGNVAFNNTVGGSSPSYTIAPGSGSGSLILSNGTSPAGISDLNGTQAISAPILLNSSALINVANTTDSLILSGAVSGSGGITLAGNGTVVFSNTESYGGATNISSGTLQVGAGGTAGAIPAGAVTDNGALAYNLSGGVTVANTISGSGTLVQEGVGTLIVSSGSNSYTGGTTIAAGTLQIGTGASIGNGPVTVNTGGLLDLNGTSLTAAGLAGTGGAIDNVSAGGTLTLTIGGGNNSAYAGVIRNTTGTINLVKVGSGNQTLTGSSSYTGTTNVSGGTLTVGVGGVIGGGATQGAVTVGDNANLAVAGGSIIAPSLSFGSNGSTVVSVTNNGSINVSTGTLTAGEITGNNLGYMSITSGTVTANAVTINRTGTNDGGSIITAGGPTTSGIYVNGGTLNVNTTLGLGTNPSNNSSANMRMDAGSVTVGGTTEITVYSTTGRFSLLDLSGGTFTSNDTTGAGIELGGGTLSDPYAELLIRGTAVVNATTITFGTPTQSSGIQALEFVGGTLNLGLGGIVDNDASSLTPTVNLGLSSSANAPLITATASWSSSVPMNLTNSNSGTAPTFQTANGSGRATAITLSGSLGGSGGLTKTGSGYLALTGGTSYIGATNISAGTLVDAQNSILSSTSAININGNMIIQNSPSLQNITQEVAEGYNSGAWNGTSNSTGIPITSTAAAGDTTFLHALGVILNDSKNGSGTQLYSTFEGYSNLNDSDVLIKYTYYGDTNLDGKVDGSDYSRVDSTYLAEDFVNGTPTNPISGWYNGDFNYDDVVDGSDYTLIDNAYNSQGALISTEVASPTAQVGSGPVSSVPEPTTMGLLALSAARLLGRRRKAAGNL